MISFCSVVHKCHERIRKEKMKKRLLVLSLAGVVLFGCNNEIVDSQSATSTGGGTSSVGTTSQNASSSSNSVVSEGNSTSSSSSVSSSSSESFSSQSSSEEAKQQATTVYLLGEQVAAKVDMKPSSTNYKYYYPAKGFGETLPDYFNENVTFKNLSANQGSVNSYTFPTDAKTSEGYNDYVANLKQGDYVLISFGINDRKIDTSKNLNGVALGTEEGQFQYNLTKYVNEAKNKGATPILLTPYVSYDSSKKYEANSKYLYNKAETKAHEGNYPQAIRDLAEELDVMCIDNTTWTADLFRSAPSDEDVQKWYCWKNSAEDGKEMTNTFNAYGAQKIGYHIADVLKNSQNALGKYIKDDIEDPTEAEYLIANTENYVKSNS